MPTVLWSKVDGHGYEYCQLDGAPQTKLFGQVVTMLDGRPCSATYTVLCALDGSTESVELKCRIAGEEKALSIRRKPDGTWQCNGDEMPHFQGLKDIDLGITPSTNTLPIRRLHLRHGESKELTAVWVRFPELSLAPLAQRYTCIDDVTYLYESVQSGYQAQITVDEDSIVVSYENEWERI